MLECSSVCYPDPCKYGTCSPSQDTYRCDCQTGATGRNCEQGNLFLPLKAQQKIKTKMETFSVVMKKKDQR